MKERYESYKDSGVPWIGQVPAGWECVKIKRCIKGLQDGTHGTYLRESTGQYLLSAKNVTDDGIVIGNNESRISQEDYESIIANGYPKKGDVLLCCVGTIGRCCIYDKNEPMAFQRSVTFIRTNEKALNRFVMYALKNNSSQIQLNEKAKASAQKGVYLNDVKEIVITLPPLPEQRAIAGYLDARCAAIDAYMASLEREAGLARELKQAVIARAVTRGLDPNTPMRDSGIPWIGQVPEGWEVRKLSQLAHEHYISNKGVNHQNLLSLSYGRVIRKDIKTTDGLLPQSFDGYQIVEKGNIILRLTDLQNDHKSLRVGLVNEEGIITSAYLCLQCTDAVLPEYIYLMLHVNDIHKVFYGMGAGVRQSLNFDGIRNMAILLPPLPEQRAIAGYLDVRCAAIDAYVASLEREADLARELKQREIADAVTGKVKITA